MLVGPRASAPLGPCVDGARSLAEVRGEAQTIPIAAPGDLGAGRHGGLGLGVGVSVSMEASRSSATAKRRETVGRHAYRASDAGLTPHQHDGVSLTAQLATATTPATGLQPRSWKRFKLTADPGAGGQSWSSKGKQPADDDEHRKFRFRRSLRILADQGASKAVSELVSIVRDEDSQQVGLDAKGVGFDVLLLATLGFGFRQLHEFAEADRAFRRASSLLEALAAKWIRPSMEVSGTGTLFNVAFAAGVASCLQGHSAWRLCCLDLKHVLAHDGNGSGDNVDTDGALTDRSMRATARDRSRANEDFGTACGGADSGCMQRLQSKAAGKRSIADPEHEWIMAASDTIDKTILVHQDSGTVLAMEHDSQGSFKFAAGGSITEHVCSPHSHLVLEHFDGDDEMGLHKAASCTIDATNLAHGWVCGPWKMHKFPDGDSMSITHAAWKQESKIMLNHGGFSFESSQGSAFGVQVHDGQIEFDNSVVVRAEHCLQELIFRIGVSLSVSLISYSDASGSKGRNPMVDMLTSDPTVLDVVSRLQILADGGTHLHVFAHSGDTANLRAELKDTSGCQFIDSQHRPPRQELVEGDEVKLSPEYRRYRDASSGPLTPDDVGIIVAVQAGSNQPLRVSYGGRSWWYCREALEPLEPPKPKTMKDRCSCINCINRSDRKGRTALHVLALNFSGRSHLLSLKEMVLAGASLHLCDELGRTPLHCLLESPCVRADNTSFATLRSALKLLANDKSLRVRDNCQRSVILAAAMSEERGAIIVFDALLNADFDWAWIGTSESDVLLHFAIKRAKALASEPRVARQHVHAADSALARLLGKHVVDTANTGSCACVKGSRMRSLKLPDSCEEVPVHSALDAFGISDNGQDAAFWEGVQTDVPVDRLLKGGWTLHSALLYNHPTKADDLDPGQGEWLCIGAREVGKDVLLVAAMAKRQDVLKRTSTSSEVHQSNGVYWYCCPGKSFGFSRHPRVDLRSADTEDQDGDYRLSWHLGTDTGGWRAGMRKNLVRERGGRFEKLIFYLRPSKIWSAEPFDRLFIGRCVIVADKSKVMSQGNDYQPVPLCWSGDEIESIHASSSNSSLTCLKDGSTQTFWESNRDESVDRRHWLEFRLKPRLTIRSFGLIAKNDTAKYCPRSLRILIGQSPGSLMSIGNLEFQNLPLDKPVMLPVITKPTITSVVRIEISDHLLGDNCRVYGVCCEVASPGDGGSEVLSGRVVDQGTGHRQGEWLVATACGTNRWFDERQLKAVGPTFPQSVSLRNLRISRLPRTVVLRGMGQFPLQALQCLCLADNQLTDLPGDLTSSLPGLVTLDLAGNLFTGLPSAIAHFPWLRRVSLSRQRGTLHEKTWLDSILTHIPSFLETVPPALQSIEVDFDCVSPLSHTLVVSLAKRTIQHCTNTCVDLRARGLGDVALEAIVPQLLECCAGRHGLIDCLRNAPHTAGTSVHLHMHPHPLVSACTSGVTASRDFCDACGCHKLSPAAGLVCEHLGCEFSLCMGCSSFLSEASHHGVRTIDTDGRRVRFDLRHDVSLNGGQSSSGKSEISARLPECSLVVTIDTEATVVQSLRWNVRQSKLLLENAFTLGGGIVHSVQLRSDAVAAGFVVQLEQLCGRTQAPAVRWLGDAASESQQPVCPIHGLCMELTAQNRVVNKAAKEEWSCGMCCSDRLGIGWRCNICDLQWCLQCWPPIEKSLSSPDLGSSSTKRVGGPRPKDLLSATKDCGAGVGSRRDSDANNGVESSCDRVQASAQDLILPIVDLRNNPITKIPPALQNAVSHSGAGVILSDLEDKGAGCGWGSSSHRLQHGIDVDKAVGGTGKEKVDECHRDDQAVCGKVVDRYLTPEHKYRYTGDISENKEHGKGKRIFSDDSTLEGMFEHGKCQGSATHTFKNGDKWFGSFKDDIAETRGVLQKHGGNWYEGEMRPEIKEHLTTELTEYLPHGKGVMWYRCVGSTAYNGTVYDGEWKMGKKHGNGILTWPGSQFSMRSKDTQTGGPAFNKDVVATYEGSWEADCMQGHGVITWPDERVFHGSFVSDRVKQGFLSSPEGSYMLTFPDNCATLRKYTPELPELPLEIKRENMGMISSDLISAVKNNAAEAYKQLSMAACLSVSDRIKLLSLHASENPPDSGRQALKVNYNPGAKDAAKDILRSLIQGQTSEQRPLVSIAKNLQWAIEIQKPDPPTNAALLAGKGKTMLKEELKKELDRRGLDSTGLKSQLEARLMEALILERPVKASELNMSSLKKELEKRGLDAKGLKRELVSRLDEYTEKEQQQKATLTAQADEVQDMFSELARGLTSVDVNGARPFMLTDSESIQPNPCAPSKTCSQRHRVISERIDACSELKDWYEAFGRLIGGALWHRKMLPVPISRFFCRRVLELLPTHRLKAYSAQGAGPPIFSGGVSALVGTQLMVWRNDDRPETSRWNNCPFPRLERVSSGMPYTVKEAKCCKGSWFLRMQEPVLGHDGWMPVSNTSAKVDSLLEPEKEWQELSRKNKEFPYNACFPKSVSSGQPVRVSAVPKPPVFYSMNEHNHDALAGSTISARGRQGDRPNSEDVELTRRVQEARDQELARCLEYGLSEDQTRLFSDIAADQERKACLDEDRHVEGLESKRLRSTENGCALSFGSADNHVDFSSSSSSLSMALLGANAWASADGVCVLPEFAMRALGLAEGDLVQVEELLPPLNKAGHKMNRGLGKCSSIWYCGHKKKRRRQGSASTSAHLARCGPDKGEPCTSCEMVDEPDCSGGLPCAQRVAWRLPRHNLAGEIHVMLQAGKLLAEVLCDRGLHVVMSGMALPLMWGGSAGSEGNSEQQSGLMLLPECVWNKDGQLVLEAVLSPDTQHELLPPVDPIRGLSATPPLPSDAVAESAFGEAGAAERVFEPYTCSLGNVDELLNGEMLSDYLESAAADDMDRDQIKKNEFGLLLFNRALDLQTVGLLPPRFAGILNGLVLSRGHHQSPILAHVDEKIEKAQASIAVSSKKRSANGAPKPTSRNTVVDTTTGKVSNSSDDRVYETNETFSVLGKQAWQLGQDEKGRVDLLEAWLRRKLHEEVQTQAFHVSRGLREVIPPGLLALFSAPELQALLGGGPAIDDPALAEWRASAEYGNGLCADDRRVKWFWEAVEAMDPGTRASVWRFSTGLTRPPPATRGGCAGLDPRFNVVGRMTQDASSQESPCEDAALATAATCHHQLVLPKYSSAEVTARQLQQSVQEGLASSTDRGSFEDSQRSLLAAVQAASARESKAATGAAVQEALRKLFPNSYMCGKCGFGPVDHVACTDLRSHHGEKRGGGQISNACPKCAWFSAQVTDWPPWDGKVWSEPQPPGPGAHGPTPSSVDEIQGDEGRPATLPNKRRRRQRNLQD